MRRWALRTVFTSALAGWMALIFNLSSLPDERVSLVGPQLGQYAAYDVPWFGSLRSILGHLVLFGILASFIQATIWSWTTYTKHSLRLAFGVLILAVLYGISDELHQSFIAGRNMSASDVLVDALGAAVDVAILRQVVKAAYHTPNFSFRHTLSQA